MMHQERKPMPNDSQDHEPKIDFTILDEAIKKVLAFKPKKKGKATRDHKAPA